MRRFISLALILLAALSVRAQQQHDLLSLAQHNVSEFLDLFSEVKCTELVTQEKLSPKGKTEYQEQSRFDYLVIADNSDKDNLSLQESRLEEKAPEHKKNVSLLVTNGFATLLLVFHPYYQDSFDFSGPEETTVNGRPLVKIRFRHVTGKRAPSVLILRGREYPLEVMGTAWIEPQTGNIVRIEADLQQDMSDIGLRILHSDVLYSPFHFHDVSAPAWLPQKAVIEVETPKQHWRNTHEFSNYQHFGVDTHAAVKEPLDAGGTQK